MTGVLQKKVIEIGKEKGFITIDDLKLIYAKNIKLEMNKLVIRGFFENPIDDGLKILWKFKK